MTVDGDGMKVREIPRYQQNSVPSRRTNVSKMRGLPLPPTSKIRALSTPAVHRAYCPSVIVLITLVIGRCDSSVGMPFMSLSISASNSGSVCTGTFAVTCTTL